MQRSTREDDKLPGLMRKLDAMCELRAKVQEACDCSFLYWHKVATHIMAVSLKVLSCHLKTFLSLFRKCWSHCTSTTSLITQLKLTDCM